MTEVIINGTKYVPEGTESTNFKVGLAITTRNRNKHLTEILKKWREFTPENIPIIIVDDSSSIPVEEATYRFEENVGIARAKNKCLELLQELGVTEYFLADDDVFPLVEEWWKPYVESPEPHLMAMFLDLAGSKKLKDITKVYEDDSHIAYSGPRGYLLYANQKVIDAVGGMDPIYGKWGYEHGDWSNRIHHEGLTSWRYADISGSENIFHSMDQYEEIERSVGQNARNSLANKNAAIHNERKNSNYKSYIPLIEPKNVIITCLYGAKPDPQRLGQTMKLSMCETLFNSLKNIPVVLYTDALEPVNYENVEIINSTLGTNVFFQRHLNAYQYLRANPQIEFAWCVDATDVEQLHDPFPQMEKGTLYVGYEPTTIKNNWLINNHPTPSIQNFIKENPNKQMFNAGVFGGDRNTMMEFLHQLTQYWFDREAQAFTKEIPNEPELGDMGGFNFVAHNFEKPVVWGSQVTTLFKHNETNANSWWRHK